MFVSGILLLLLLLLFKAVQKLNELQAGNE